MSLPNPTMDFSAFDVLTAAELDDLVENDQALAAGTGINDGAITPVKLQTGTATTHVWQSWTPTFTNITLNNGTLSYSKFIQLGKTVHFRIKIIFGSTTAYGTDLLFSTPVNFNADYAVPDPINSTVSYYDASALTSYLGTAQYASSSTIRLRVIHTDGPRANVEGSSGGNPFAFATGDIIYCSGSYQAA